MRKLSLLVAMCIVYLFVSCVSKDYYEIELENDGWEIAIPIVNAKTTINRLAGSARNTDIVIDEEDRVTIIYRGNVINQVSPTIFPPIPYFADFPIIDSVAPLNLPIDGEFLLSKAIFKRSRAFFNFKSSRKEDIQIKMRMPELSKDGQAFEFDYVLKYEGGDTSYLQTPVIPLLDWVANTSDNTISFNYEAITPDGERIVLDYAGMNIDIIEFSYVEGFFGYREFELQGNAIPIGIFNNWLSGGFSFDKPKISLAIENSFGFPVTADLNRLEILTLEGNVLPIESEVLDQGIEFNYPTLEEVGEVAFNSLIFDTNNSNLEEIFNEKAISVNYDIAAYANPVSVDTVIGFFSDESYFDVKAQVEVPLHARIQDLVLQDSFDIDFSPLEDIDEATLKFEIKNGLPVQVELLPLFAQGLQQGVDYLNNNEWIKVDALDKENQPIENQALQTFEFVVDADNWKNLSTSDRIVFKIRVNTIDSNSDEYIWLYDEQGIEIKLGAIAKTN